MTRFFKFALSGLTAFSLSIAPLPAAADPDGEDIAKVLAGLAVLGIIATAANDRQTDRKKASSLPAAGKSYGSIEDDRFPRTIDGKIRRPGERYGGKGARRNPLPDRCVRFVTTNRIDRPVYDARCLSKTYAYVNRLPDRCRLHVRTGNRVRDVYGAHCLRRDGWQVAGF